MRGRYPLTFALLAASATVTAGACSSSSKGEVLVYPMTNIAVGSADGLDSFAMQVSRLGEGTNDPGGPGSRVVYTGSVPADQVTLGSTFFRLLGTGRVRVDLFGVRGKNIFVRASLTTEVGKTSRAYTLWLDGSCVGETVGSIGADGPVIASTRCSPPVEAGAEVEAATSTDDGGAPDAGATGVVDYDYTCRGGLCQSTEEQGYDASPPSDGNGATVCLDTTSCFAGQSAAQASATCTLDVPAGAAQVSVAAVVAPGNGAVCSGASCFFVLPPSSWQLVGGSVELIPTECMNGRYVGFVVSTTCALGNGEGICGAGGDAPDARTSSAADASVDQSTLADTSVTQMTGDAKTDGPTTTFDANPPPNDDGSMTPDNSADCGAGSDGLYCPTPSNSIGACTENTATCLAGTCAFQPANDQAVCSDDGTQTCKTGVCQ